MPYNFNPNYKPTPPRKPSKTLLAYTVVKTYSTTYPSKDELVKLVNDYSGEEYNWSCEVDYYGYDSTDPYPEYPQLRINIRLDTPQPNAKYEEQLIQYKKIYTEYKKARSEWDEKKAKHDQLLNAKKEAKELKILERLKKKYESEN